MQLHTQDDLIQFLSVVDKHLKKSHQLIIIGGAAASLAYGSSRTTTDIDTATTLTTDFQSAAEKAREETGLNVPVNEPRIYDAPYGWEERLVFLINLNLENIRIFVPERHDLVLMKVIRWEDSDIQAAEDVHANDPLELATLIDRFTNEMTQVIGNPRMVRLNFVDLIRLLFGEEEAREAELLTQNWGVA